MEPLPTRTAGHGATVLLVHGVGLDARHWSPVVERVAEHARVVVVDRPGYGTATDHPARTIDEQVAAILATVARLPDPPLYVGVSGGATLGLRVVGRIPDAFRGAVLHEPLVGHFARPLQQRVRAAAERLAADADPGASTAFVRQLVGPTSWSAITPRDITALGALDPVIRREVAQFAALELSAPELHRLRALPVVTTVGRASDAQRLQAAAALAAIGGASVRRIPGDHFAPACAPDALATVILDLLDRPRSEAS